MKRFIIHADQKFAVWQANIFIIDAENKEDAINKLKGNPSEYCVDTESLVNTEEFIETDFKENFEIEEEK
jgi:hypothetical protein